MVSEGWLTVPVGVMVPLPPVAPTSPLAAIVPRSIFPLSADTSDQPEGQLPDTMSEMSPLGMLVPPITGELSAPVEGLIQSQAIK